MAKDKVPMVSTELYNGGANTGVAKEEDEKRLGVLIDHLNEAFGAE